MNQTTGTCVTCKHLIRYKKVNDPFWHYACVRYPKATDFDNTTAIKLTRSKQGCGYEKEEMNDITPELKGEKDELYSKFSKRWCDILGINDL